MIKCPNLNIETASVITCLAKIYLVVGVGAFKCMHPNIEIDVKFEEP